MKELTVILLIGCFFGSCQNTIEKKKEILIENEYSVLGEEYKYSSFDSTDDSYGYYFLTIRFFADSIYQEIQDSLQNYNEPSGFDGKYYIKDSILYCERRNTVIQWRADSTSKIMLEGIYSRFPFIELHSKYLIKGDSLINLSNPEVRLYKVKETE